MPGNSNTQVLQVSLEGELIRSCQWNRRGFSHRRSSWTHLVALLSKWNPLRFSGCNGHWPRSCADRHYLLRARSTRCSRFALGNIDSTSYQSYRGSYHQLDRDSNYPGSSQDFGPKRCRGQWQGKLFIRVISSLVTSRHGLKPANDNFVGCPTKRRVYVHQIDDWKDQFCLRSRNRLASLLHNIESGRYLLRHSPFEFLGKEN